MIGKSIGGKLSVGLGSVIMKTVAELHGGAIKINNASGDLSRGAVVSITVQGLG
jgi:nitrogen fixation/metabolism regulation signal transduction histidine kinase